MSFAKGNRIVLIKHIRHCHSELSTTPVNKSSEEIICKKGAYFVTPSHYFNEDHDLYLFPYILNCDLSPWTDANLFLYTSALNRDKGYSSSDAIRLKASLLVDYKIYCEGLKIDLYDFSGRKPKRPTYRYFFHLLQQVNEGALSRKKLNQSTKVVYDFYRYLSEQHKSSIDIERVDSVKLVNRYFHNHHGGLYSMATEKRGQSLSVNNSSRPRRIGFTREYGEELRPLTDKELDELLACLNTDAFGVDERLMHFIALQVGARKQSILTMRMKHLKLFADEKLLKDGTFKVNAGPGTGIDTKYNKPQALYFPLILAKSILRYANSEKAKRRRQKFLQNNGNILNEDDMYLFISSSGGTHYMAKSDPRYIFTRSRPQGRNTYYMSKKLSKLVSEKFPSDFVFHWLRATYALRYYLFLQPLYAKGLITDSDIISMVQKRLHHSNREVTENYLKLFDSIDKRLVAQQLYEERVFDLYGTKMDFI